MESTEQSKLISKRELEAQKRGTAVKGDWLKDEEIRQRTYIHDPWTGTKVWGLTIEEGDKVGGRGKIGATIIAQVIKSV